ncbi:nucleotide pyrophosphohydrolase [Mucisphaera sp.]|uniref:nucleotide pyrophosphohydrolase n=1 Tax=Mucisphaera sp. TaxID=2913024 RepID=UPI003D1302E6
MTPPDDHTATLQQLKDRVAHFVTERDWDRYHQPKNLAMSIAIEAAELMELFQWDPHDNPVKPLTPEAHKQRVREELADTLAYLLSLANKMDIDITQAFEAKMTSNEQRYPAP